jgi:hypothetical protein
MSRHEISARNPAHKVIVGWHQPLRTYFVQVIDRAWEAAGDDNRRMLLCVGKPSNSPGLPTSRPKRAQRSAATRTLAASFGWASPQNELCDVDQLGGNSPGLPDLTPETSLSALRRQGRWPLTNGPLWYR